MKVLLINGSQREHGCTDAALNIIAAELKAQGVDSQIYWIGRGAVHSCMGCGYCRNAGKCVYNDDIVNQLGELCREADGFVFGSPVHYASPAGALIAVLDRLFYSHGRYLKYKPAASIVSARRAGTTASYDVLNKYIGISSMLQVPSTYWNGVHGSSAEDVLKDEEGVTVMRAVASNMAWLLKLLDSVRGTELEKPVAIKKAMTNFIR